MNIEVVSTIHNDGYKKYAYKNYTNFVNYWPSDIKLTVYSEDILDDKLNGVIYKDLFKEIPECQLFVDRNKDIKWKPPYRQKRYKQDFIKFCYKVFVTCHHALNSNADFLIWLDGDINTKANFNVEKNLHYFDPNYFCWFLGRDYCERNKNKSDSVSTETGIIIFNLNHPISKDFFEDYKNIYETDKLFGLNEVHDGYVFDIVRKKYKQKYFKAFYQSQDADFPLRKIDLGKILEHQIGSKKWQTNSN